MRKLTNVELNASVIAGLGIVIIPGVEGGFIEMPGVEGGFIEMPSSQGGFIE